jgi:aspartate aminotransferase
MLSHTSRSQIQRSGSVRAAFEEARAAADQSDDGVLDLALAQPFGVPPAAVVEALAMATRERGPDRFHYMPNAGYYAVRSVVADHADIAGVTAESIVMTAGAAGAIALALRTFTNPGDEVVLLPPYFPEYLAYCQAASLTPVAAPLDPSGASFDVNFLEVALSRRTRAVLLNTPVNPTGRVFSRDELAAVADVLTKANKRRRRPIVLIVDEVYHRLTFTPAQHVSPIALYSPTVIARSFSKDFGLAGERLGYLVLDPVLRGECVEGVEHWQRALGFVNASATAQRALLHLSDWRIDLRALLLARDEACAAFGASGLEVLRPDAGLCVFVRTPTRDSRSFVRRLSERNVFVVAGESFGAPGWFRACFSRERQVIRAAGGTLANLLSQSPDFDRSRD